MVLPAVSVPLFEAVKTCAATYPGCFAAYGIHPLYVMQAQEREVAILRDWLQREPAIAIGEIGLDFYIPTVDPQKQHFFFVEQLKLAREFDLPVLLHVRRAVDRVLQEVRRFGIRRGIAHAFNGSQQQAELFIRQGFKLGVGGAMTYPGSTRIRQLAQTLPLESLVLETDAPDIPPAWLNRGRNTPDQLVRIAQALADLRAIPVEAVIEQTSANARSVLPGLVANWCGTRESGSE